MECSHETGPPELRENTTGASRLLKRKYIIALSVFAVAVVADQYTKFLVSEHLYQAKKEIIPGFLDFKYAENPGMAFGMLQDLKESFRVPLFTGITVVAVFIIFHLLRQAPAASRRMPTAMGLILSGAVGNLLDRFQGNGSVVDFIRVRLWPPSNFHWPTFNLADTFITIGIFLLLLDMFFSGEEEFQESGSESREEEQGSDMETQGGPTDEGRPAEHLLPGRG
ncbi:MAG: signal peptidase II [bacterium]